MVAIGAVPLSAAKSLGVANYKLIQRKRSQARAKASSEAASRVVIDSLGNDPEVIAAVKVMEGVAAGAPAEAAERGATRQQL